MRWRKLLREGRAWRVIDSVIALGIEERDLRDGCVNPQGLGLRTIYRTRYVYTQWPPSPPGRR